MYPLFEILVQNNFLYLILHSLLIFQHGVEYLYFLVVCLKFLKTTKRPEIIYNQNILFSIEALSEVNNYWQNSFLQVFLL